MSEVTHNHINYCPMAKVNDKGESRVKSCPGKEIVECENEGPESECSLISTDHICNNFECQIVKRLDDLELELEKEKENSAKLKAINDQFRLIMHLPDIKTVERLIKESKLDFSGINGIIGRYRPSWDLCEDATIIYQLAFTQKISESYAQYLQERNSKVRIKDLVIQKGKEETKKAIVKIQEGSKQRKEFNKHLASYTKIGMSENKARELLLKMGIKEQ